MAKRRIRVAEFRGEDIEIEFSDGSVFPIRGDLPVEVILYMSELEEEASAEAEEDEGVAWIARGRELLLSLIHEKTPGAVLPMLSPQEVLGTLASIAGGETVGAAVAAALRDGQEETGEETGDGSEGERGTEDGEDGPLATATGTTGSRSEKPSSGRSSGSRSRTAGTRPGGAGRRGRKSSSSSSSETKSEAA